MSIQNLPSEILFHQLSYLDYPSLLYFCNSNTYYSEICPTRLLQEKKYDWLYQLLVPQIISVLDMGATALTFTFNGNFYDISSFTLDTDYILLNHNIDTELDIYKSELPKYLNPTIKNELLFSLTFDSNENDLFSYFKNLSGSQVQGNTITININSILQSLES